MKISVIIPAYNCYDDIKHTIYAIYNQTISVHEVIVINDNSSDSTLSVLLKLKNNFPRLKVLSNQINRGPAYSRNIGVKESIGDVICFCDSDDIWHNNKLEKQLSYIQKYPLIGSSYEVIVKDTSKRISVNLEGIFSFTDFLKDNYLASSSVMVNLNVISKEDIFFQNVVHEDYLLWLSLLKKYNCKCLVLADILFDYYRRNNSFSSGFAKKILANYFVYRKIGFNKIVSCFYTLRKILNALKRY